MKPHRFAVASLIVLSLSAYAYTQGISTSRSGVKAQPRFFNPFAVQANLTISAFGNISNTSIAPQSANVSAPSNLIAQASGAAAPTPPVQANGPPSRTPGNGRVPFNLRPPFRPPARSPFQPPGPPFDPPGPPFDPPGPPPVVPPPFQ
jgi:hypothetical protein